MALRPVIEITPSRVRVARDGVDVTNPPDDTPKYLAFSSDWPKIERVHTRAVLKKTSLLDRPLVPFALLSEPPFGILLMRIVHQVFGNLRPIFYDIHAHTSEPFLTNENADYLYDKYRIAWITKNNAMLEQHIKEEITGSGVNAKRTRQPDPDRSFDFIFLAIRP